MTGVIFISFKYNRQTEIFICRFIEIRLYDTNISSVRVCHGLLPPVLNAVAEIIAEAGSPDSVFGASTCSAEFASSSSLVLLSQGIAGIWAGMEASGRRQLGLQEAVWTQTLPSCFK